MFENIVERGRGGERGERERRRINSVFPSETHLYACACFGCVKTVRE